jgi:phenylpropionate dioxygenase-like ring-hydroxylating dioxygenase large terminal subunit
MTTSYLGREYRREHDGTYLQNWNPLLLAAELPPGKIVGRDFLGTRVIVYRDPDGKPIVQSAYCPHVGADLSQGEIVNGRVRCAYHHWQFATDGKCVAIPSTNRIPPVARIYNYPAAERWGLIWAFNGVAPLHELPEMPNIPEQDLYYKVFHHGLRPIEGWISSSNLVDFQHLTSVHGIADAIPKSVVFDKYVINVRQESASRIADTRLYGGTWLTAHTQYSDGTERMFMAGSSQVGPGQSDAYFIVLRRKSEVEKLGVEAANELIEKQVAYVKKLYREDEPILFTMRFRGRGKSALLDVDRHFGAFLDYIEKYPRSAPFDV